MTKSATSISSFSMARVRPISSQEYMRIGVDLDEAEVTKVVKTAVIMESPSTTVICASFSVEKWVHRLWVKIDLKAKTYLEEPCLCLYVVKFWQQLNDKVKDSVALSVSNNVSSNPSVDLMDQHKDLVDEPFQRKLKLFTLDEGSIFVHFIWASKAR